MKPNGYDSSTTCFVRWEVPVKELEAMMSEGLQPDTIYWLQK